MRRGSTARIITVLLLSFSLIGCAGSLKRDQHPEGKGTVALAPTTPSSAPPADLWQRIRAGFRLPGLDSRHVAYYEKWNRDRPDYLARMVERARLYLFYIVEEVERRDMPMEIALLPAIESAFKPNAYSRARAAGLWQFIPSTGRHYGLKQNWWYDGRRDVLASTRAALDYLEKLHQDFDGDWFLAIAAYNAGEARVEREIQRNRRLGRPTDFVHLSGLKAETRRYVPKLIAMRNIVRDPASYGLNLAVIPNRAYFQVVRLDTQIDLGVVAREAGLSSAETFALNPAFRRWATDPSGPHHLLVPVGQAPQFSRNLAALSKQQRLRWARHRVRAGDSLHRISNKYGVSVASIKSSNRLRSNLIHPGRDLLIPLSSQPRTKHATRRSRTGKSYRMAKASQGQRGGTRLVHQVRQGDTLWGIAQHYNVYVKQLRRWNSIDVREVLQLGQNIHVYVQ